MVSGHPDRAPARRRRPICSNDGHLCRDQRLFAYRERLPGHAQHLHAGIRWSTDRAAAEFQLRNRSHHFQRVGFCLHHSQHRERAWYPDRGHRDLRPRVPGRNTVQGRAITTPQNPAAVKAAAGNGLEARNRISQTKGKNMKKLLPTLLPLLSTGLIAIVPQLQHFLIAFVAAHPGWSSFATAAALILNHWLPSPGAVPADSTIAKAGTSLMLCFALITVPFTTGCNYSQADVIKAVQNTESVFKTAQTFLPQAQVIANELQQTDPEAAEYVNDLVGIAGPALQKL